MCIQQLRPAGAIPCLLWECTAHTASCFKQCNSKTHKNLCEIFPLEVLGCSPASDSPAVFFGLQIGVWVRWHHGLCCQHPAVAATLQLRGARSTKLSALGRGRLVGAVWLVVLWLGCWGRAWEFTVTVGAS